MGLSVRWTFFLSFLLCALMLAIAGYFQFVKSLEPCPLCILSRVVVLAMGGVFLMAAVHNPKGWGLKVYAWLGFVITLIGIGLSGRHVWLQNLPPDQIPACGPGLSFILDNFPLTEALELVLRGSGECAEVQWNFLGLTIPGWTLVAFLFLGGISLWQMRRA
ncbi:disulfide bond formation protein B [Nitrosococcus wardiae]|uniref:Disulfide bond formation protein B n=1 Tax=Nitrosococcus wardiae TaxID=1814290 RepID=A0A4P7BWZ0_9GAMM|nr:disulfide bond formation protein B [Nitrosococcus wardiae]QBQ53610.1 disulfide bond formation protein B [Nitrosococcus wardiae]